MRKRLRLNGTNALAQTFQNMFSLFNPHQMGDLSSQVFLLD